MQDIVESALENADKERHETVKPQSTEFGPPQFLYIGCGERGESRVAAGLTDRTYDDPPPTSLGDLVTALHVGDDVAAAARANSLGRLLEDTQTDAELNQQALETIDLCLLTVDRADPQAVAAAANVAEFFKDTPTIVFASTPDGGARGPPLDSLRNTTNMTVLLNESLIDGSPLGGGDVSPEALVDRHIRNFVTNIVELLSVPGPISVNYARVWDLWQSDGVAIPSVAKLDRDDFDVEAIKESLVPLARADESLDSWFGYAVGGAEFTLAELEQLRETLPAALGGELEPNDGVLGGRIRADSEDTLVVSTLQMR